jgi:hypothetical protein
MISVKYPNTLTDLVENNQINFLVELISSFHS